MPSRLDLPEIEQRVSELQADWLRSPTALNRQLYAAWLEIWQQKRGVEPLTQHDDRLETEAVP